MRKICINFSTVFFLLLFSPDVYNQIPFPDLVVENLNLNSGNYTFTNPLTGIISPNAASNPVILKGSSVVNYFGGTSISLNPGFNAGAYSTGGIFFAQIRPPDFEVVLFEPTSPDAVPEFEKLELGIKIPKNIQEQIDNFFKPPAFSSGINPYNPADIDVYGVLTSPTNRTIRWNCFYYREYVNNHDDNPHDFTWLEIPTDYPWRMRFAPDEIGQWSLSLTIKVSSSLEYHVNNIIFNCTQNPNNQGYIVTGIHKRNLKFSKTNNSFFIIGENLQWSDKDHYPNGTYIGDVMAQDYDTYNDWTDEIHENGGNFIAIGLYPWCYGLEWEHAGIFDLHDLRDQGNPKNTNRQINAWELDRLFNMARTKRLYIKLPLLIHDEFQHAYIPNNWANWEHNPYHLEYPWLQSPIDFFTNTTAIELFTTRYLRYVMARWGYSTNLAWYDLCAEVDNFDEYSLGIVNAWVDQVAHYISSVDNNHIVGVGYSTTNTTNNSSYNHGFGSAYIGFSNAHDYSDYKYVNIAIRYDIAKKYRNIWDDKPFIFDEIGPSLTYDCADVDLFNIHNALWSSSFMGGMGCGLVFSWQRYMHSNDKRVKNFKALSQFMADADFETYNFAPHRYSDYFPYPFPPYNGIEYRIENFWLINHSSNFGRGWVHNAVAYWANFPGQQCGRANEDIYTYPYSNHNDHWIMDNLNIGQMYEAHLYNIEWNDGCYYEFTQRKRCNIAGIVAYPVGDMFERHDDYAYKLDHGKIGCSTDSLEPEILPCPFDTIYTTGIYANDTSETLHYYWDFGNGSESTLVHPKIYYNQPGIYPITLFVTDSVSLYDTVRQTFIVPDSCFDSIQTKPIGQIGLENLGSLNPNIIIYPNPSKGLSTLLMDKETAEISTEVKIYSMMGTLLKKIKLNNFLCQYIDIRNLSSGMYIIKIETKDSKNLQFRIIKN